MQSRSSTGLAIPRHAASLSGPPGQYITGFRAEEESAFNAEPYVRTGRVQIVIGI